MKHIAVIDYGAGNLRSVTKALEHITRSEDVEIKLVTTAAGIIAASHIILPGVGAFADCMRGLQKLSGVITTLEDHVLHRGKPFLGICVGMQMLLETGHEHGTHQGLGWFKGEVLPLTPTDPTLKIPHMGWNDLQLNLSHWERACPVLDTGSASESKTGDGIHPLLAGIHTGDHAYFVHSYHCAMQHSAEIIATADYGGNITAAIARDNIFGAQFHPEKSQQTGLRLFQNFIQREHAPSR